MSALYESLCRWYCRKFHGAPYHPIAGIYRCRQCLQEYEAWPLPPLDVFDKSPRVARESGIQREWRERDEKRTAEVAELDKMYNGTESER